MKKSNDQHTQKIDQSVTPVNEEAVEWKNKYLRALADYQNLQRRIQEDNKELYERTERDLVKNLIEIADLFDEVLKHDVYKNDHGLHAVRNRLASVLHGYGVDGQPVVGTEFDPNLMYCVSVREPIGKEKENEVVEEINRLYLHRSKVYRPAHVIVAKKKDV